MIDVSAAKWDLSKEEHYAVKWFDKNGFDGKLVKQFLSKTKFTIHRDGVTDHFELPQGLRNMDVKKYMEQYGQSFLMLRNLVELRKEAKC